MRTMRAAVVHRRGGPEVISVDIVPVPEIGPSDALVRVRACGLNRMDIWARTGPPQPIFPWKERDYPLITGGDIAGEVAAVGSTVTAIRVGDRVTIYGGLSCGTCEYCLAGEQSMCPEYHIFGEHTNGGFAEFVAVPATNLEPLPADLDFVAAAAIPAAYTTAWRLVETAGQVTPRDASTPVMQRPLGLQGDPVRPVQHECREGQQADQHGVPIEDTRHRAARVEGGPQGREEVAARVQRHAPHDVAERRPEEERQQRAAEEEESVPEGRPEGIVAVRAQLNRQPPQHQQPQDDRQG